MECSMLPDRYNPSSLWAEAIHRLFSCPWSLRKGPYNSLKKGSVQPFLAGLGWWCNPIHPEHTDNNCLPIILCKEKQPAKLNKLCTNLKTIHLIVFFFFLCLAADQTTKGVNINRFSRTSCLFVVVHNYYYKTTSQAHAHWRRRLQSAFEAMLLSNWRASLRSTSQIVGDAIPLHMKKKWLYIISAIK